jgi:hypothetical protein
VTALVIITCVCLRNRLGGSTGALNRGVFHSLALLCLAGTMLHTTYDLLSAECDRRCAADQSWATACQQSSTQHMPAHVKLISFPHLLQGWQTDGRGRQRSSRSGRQRSSRQSCSSCRLWSSCQATRCVRPQLFVPHTRQPAACGVPRKCRTAAEAPSVLTAENAADVQVSYAQKLCPQAGDAAAPGHKQLQLVAVTPAAAAKEAADDAGTPADGAQDSHQPPSVAPPAVCTSPAGTAPHEAGAAAEARTASAAGPAAGDAAETDAAATDAAGSVWRRLRRHCRERAAHHAAEREAHRQREAAWIQRRAEQLGLVPAAEPAPAEVSPSCAGQDTEAAELQLEPHLWAQARQGAVAQRHAADGHMVAAV